MSKRQRQVLARVAPRWSLGPNKNSDHIIEFTISQMQATDADPAPQAFVMLETSQGDKQFARKQTAFDRATVRQLRDMLTQYLEDN